MAVTMGPRAKVAAKTMGLSAISIRHNHSTKRRVTRHVTRETCNMTGPLEATFGAVGRVFAKKCMHC
eukprot:5527563-Pleurochrysis_carterae.AAC.1